MFGSQQRSSGREVIVNATGSCKIFIVCVVGNGVSNYFAGGKNGHFQWPCKQLEAFGHFNLSKLTLTKSANALSIYKRT